MSRFRSPAVPTILVAILAPALACCGGGSIGGDAGDEDDGAEDGPSETVDAAGDGGCTLDLTETVAAEQEALFEEESSFWVWEGVIGGETVFPPVDIAQIEIWTAHGGPAEPGSYVVSAGSYADCGLCVLVRKGCRPDEGLARCEKDYLATSGALEIDEMGAVGENLSGTLTGAVLVETAIDWEGGTYSSVPVPGGAVLCLDSLEFSSDVSPYPIR